MAPKDAANLRAVREQVVAQRRALAAELVVSSRRNGKWDAQVSAIVTLQQAIETIDRAIQDEKA
jgi:hypothetical protein